jgi:hypothetical protein
MSEQQRLFDDTRYSPVSVAIYQLLPESNARAFAIASALGSYRDESGSSDRLRSGRQAAGSLVSSRRLPIVLAALGVSDRQWRRYVQQWIKLYAAHRCMPGSGSVFLFARPELTECPSCHVEIEIRNVPEYQKQKKKPRDPRGRYAAKPVAVTRPNGGPNAAKGADVSRPDFERKSATPKSGFLQGLELGVSVLEGSGLQEVSAQKAQKEIAARANETDGDDG